MIVPKPAFQDPTRSRLTSHLPLLLLGCLGLFWIPGGFALQLDPVPPPLKGIPVPPTPGLTDGPNPIVIDRAAAIQLGKALFWDMNLGSDGVACATCHFHAGADRRTRNQLEPGGRHAAPAGKTFEKTAAGAAGGVNYALKARDFPFYRFAKPEDRSSKVLFSTDDVVSSSGVAYGLFQPALSLAGKGKDACSPLKDDIFHLAAGNTRRVTTRNAPTVINAAFNYRNFWDGRANNRFNGETPYGPRNPDAGVWEVREGATVKAPLALENAALASQAMAPVVDTHEMACAGRTFQQLARRLLPRRPLERQEVHPEDSVLGPLRAADGAGLTLRYEDLIRTSFAPRYWSGSGDFGKPDAGPPFSQMEANFAFFLGLALQIYEATLIADETPFDTPRGADGFPAAFNESQKRGHVLFNKAECDFCHRGPGFSAAEHPAVYSESHPSQPPKLVDRRVMNIDRATKTAFTALSDSGYANTGVTPNDFDPGLGGRDPMGHPLSFTEPYVASLADPAKPPLDPVAIPAFNFSLRYRIGFEPEELIAPTAAHGYVQGNPEQAMIPAPAVARAELAKPGQGRLAMAVNGAFKVPSLRNVELTGPYMHNGGMKNLKEVIEFYDRGGNVDNREHFGTFVFAQHFTPQEKADLLAFLLTLTDERVRWERAPFDHPALAVPHGYEAGQDRLAPSALAEATLRIPAVGRGGRTAEQGPLLPFEHYLPR
jgi:cytochrome c peroxidase